MRDVLYLSQPAEVSMADQWFQIAAVDHFWIRRRFKVMQQLAGNIVSEAAELAEIGCGHGLLQRQVEDAFHREISGFDLNELALKKNVSLRSPVACYDISHKNQKLKNKFDVLFLFDVLEHIEDEVSFIDALLFHLAPNGKIIVNVPSGQWAYSAYDRAAGHKRRYSAGALAASVARCNLRVTKWTYWGMPLLPTVVLRKLWLLGKSDEDKIISEGFDPRHPLINEILGHVSDCEPIPQKLIGTSLMAVLEIDPKSAELSSR